jgi:hypothetical protein
MKTLLHLVHAAASVKPLYESAMRAAGLDVDIVTVLPPAAEHGALSSAYAGLCSTWALVQISSRARCARSPQK